MALLACPFCREMYSAAEAEVCPMCGLALTAYHKLPQAQGFDPTDNQTAVAPEDERVPFTSLRHNRGALVAVALLGLGAFFLPWIDMQFPVVGQLSGVDLARRTGWTWAVPAAWFVMIPTVLSRRTPRRMQSARVAAGMLAMFPGLAVSTLLLNPPRGAYGLKPRFVFVWPLHTTLVLSVLGVVLAATFGLSWGTWRKRNVTLAASTEPKRTSKLH